MNENLAYKINSSFHLLGLKPGADARQIRSAFRRLARTYHPDVAGAFNTKKYEQISSAYLLLKNLTPEELSLCEVKVKYPESVKESFFARWKRTRAEKEAKREAEIRAQREAEEAAEEARERAIAERVSSILDKCAKEMDLILKKKQNEKLNREITDIVIRLEASRYEVRLMTMRNISKYIGVPRISEALLNMLDRYPITGEMLDLIDKLPLPHGLMQKIVKIVSDNVNVLRENEILPFIKKVIFIVADKENIISKFMRHPSLKVSEFLMPRWTFPAMPDENALKRIFSDIKNEKLIILTLNILKKHDKNMYPNWLTQKIDELMTHESASVRLWARAVSSNENMIK